MGLGLEHLELLDLRLGVGVGVDVDLLVALRRRGRGAVAVVAHAEGAQLEREARARAQEPRRWHEAVGAAVLAGAARPLRRRPARLLRVERRHRVGGRWLGLG